MATVQLAKTPRAPGPSRVEGNRVVLEGVSWDTYERLLAGLEGQRVFVTYDDGLMEIEMSPSLPHENRDRLLERLVYAIGLLTGVKIASGGTTTHRRQDLKKGLEPDACFWIENEHQLVGVRELDLTKVPPPDLVIEIDVHAESTDRIAMYQQLQVPEIWLLRDGELQFLTLENTRYARVDASRSFPIVGRAAVGRALQRIDQVGEDTALTELLSELGLR
ncbi:MAG: Uma2 family endonuclease [Planctomycetota bacterium]